MFVGLNNFIKECSSQFPDHLPKQACLGFLGTVAVGLLGGATLQVALVGGAVAIAASIIEAVARSIIQASFKEKSLMKLTLKGFLLSTITFELTPIATYLLRAPFQSAHYLIRFIGLCILNKAIDPNATNKAYAFIL